MPGRAAAVAACVPGRAAAVVACGPAGQLLSDVCQMSGGWT